MKKKNAAFDVMMAIDVFEHIEDYFGFLRKLRKKAKYKIFHIPLDLSAQSIMRGNNLLKRRQEGGHIHCFTKETALAALKDTGYEVIDYFYTKGSLDLKSKGIKPKILRLPRTLLFAANKDWAARVLGGFSLLVLAK